MREATVESSGFCEPCHAADIAERYQERERIEYEARNRGWKEWDRERQRHHKLKVKLRPTEPARPEVDPLELGKEALYLLSRMRPDGPRQAAIRQQVGELVRQLAWGPVDVSDAPEPRPAP
jgi:hypothetical protein